MVRGVWAIRSVRPRRFGTSTAERPAVMDGHRGQEHAVARVGDHFAAARMIAEPARKEDGGG